MKKYIDKQMLPVACAIGVIAVVWVGCWIWFIGSLSPDAFKDDGGHLNNCCGIETKGK